ncbi:MAG: hypothetical protein COA50_15985 [Flavobacteriaceae bacterium]|nr:MAG: hypothetical protein COA50_15985 [Flavobacteriaceae bacterium]
MKNKIYLSTLLFLTSFFWIQAQNDGALEDNLNISVVVPLQMDGLTTGQVSKIESKMLRMVSNYGISGEGYTDKFIIYPKYEIYDHKVVEGMQNVHILDVELNLIVKEVRTGKVYSVYNQEITGDGYSRKEAINQSISQMKTKGAGIKIFLQSAKTKILEYYRSNCDRLYDEASTMVNQKRYNEAIALLYPVPEEVRGDCYKKIQRKLDEAYDGYLNKTCEKNLIRAKAEISKNNNESALEILASIDTESNCHSSAQKLKAKIEVENESVEQTNTVKSSSVVQVETSKVRKKRRIKAVVKAEFIRSRHQGEIDRAIEES